MPWAKQQKRTEYLDHVVVQTRERLEISENVNLYWLLLDLELDLWIPALACHWHELQGCGIGCIQLDHLMTHFIEHLCSLKLKM